jgi:hypothetical protein
MLRIQFVACAAVILVCGSYLSKYGNITEKPASEESG